MYGHDIVELRKPDDMHVHLRQGNRALLYATDCLPWFGKVLVMPNTQPPICNTTILDQYRKLLRDGVPGLEFLMTFMLTASQSGTDVEALIDAGALAGKLYPAGVTTNSRDGVRDMKSIYPALEVMQDKGAVLCIHGEEPGKFSLHSEREYLSSVNKLMSDFPRLKIVLEHVSHRDSVAFVLSGDHRLAATITVHHLLLTLDDILGDQLNPHHFCKPIAKTPEDREAVRRAAFSGNPKFFLGTDSAPHLRETKETAPAPAGIYSIPVAVPLLVQIFEKAGYLERLEDFTSRYGSEFYGLPLNREKIRLRKETWKVPPIINNTVPLLAGRKVDWKLVPE